MPGSPSQVGSRPGDADERLTACDPSGRVGSNPTPGAILPFWVHFQAIWEKGQ